MTINMNTRQFFARKRPHSYGSSMKMVLQYTPYQRKTYYLEKDKNINGNGNNTELDT